MRITTNGVRITTNRGACTLDAILAVAKDGHVGKLFPTAWKR